MAGESDGCREVEDPDWDRRKLVAHEGNVVGSRRTVAVRVVDDDRVAGLELLGDFADAPVARLERVLVLHGTARYTSAMRNQDDRSLSSLTMCT